MSGREAAIGKRDIVDVLIKDGEKVVAGQLEGLFCVVKLVEKKS